MRGAGLRAIWTGFTVFGPGLGGVHARIEVDNGICGVIEQIDTLQYEMANEILLIGYLPNGNNRIGSAKLPAGRYYIYFAGPD